MLHNNEELNAKANPKMLKLKTLTLYSSGVFGDVWGSHQR